jgi:signal peptidase II
MAGVSAARPARRSCFVVGLICALLTVLIDQAHKYWMLGIYRIQDRGRVPVTSFLDLVYVKNFGISYGLFAQDGHDGQWILIVFAVLVAIGLAVWMALSATSLVMALSLGLLIGGAIGNAIDRAHMGGVADFFSLHAFGFYWYVFNIADVAIVAGVCGLLYESFGASHKGAAKGP